MKSFYDKGLQNTTDFSDDVTVGNASDLMSQRFSMMYVVPGTEKGIDEDEAPLEAIRRMNEMIRSLINKCPSVKFRPWIGEPTKLNPLLTEFPEDVDIAERYAFDLIDLFLQEIGLTSDFMVIFPPTRPSVKLNRSSQDLKSHAHSFSS